MNTKLLEVNAQWADRDWDCTFAKGKSIIVCSKACNQPHCLKKRYLLPIIEPLNETP
jgi:hypothetical protein